MSRFHELTMRSITGEEVSLAAYRGKVCLVVNVASL
jgi:glutathione peroxidase-family protein